MKLGDWVNKIYGEEDFGRSISTTVSGVIGLSIYLGTKDWALSLFVSVIVFPLLRLLASTAHGRWKESHKEKLEAVEAQKSFKKFSPEERQVIKAFVDAGGSALSWSLMKHNNICLPTAGVESLAQRGVLRHTTMADGFNEGLVIDLGVFDLAQQAFPRSRSSASTPDADDVPF